MRFSGMINFRMSSPRRRGSSLDSCLRRNDRQTKGSAVVMIILFLPLMIFMIGFLVDVGRVSLARARLSVASDRAAYAGASAISHAMNTIAAENWKINKAYRDLKKNYDEQTQQNNAAAKDVFTQYENLRDAALSKMNSIWRQMFDEAQSVSRDVFFANAPYAEMTTVAPYKPTLSDNIENDQYGNPSYHRIEGTIFTDPETVEGGSVRALRYEVKKKNPDTIFGVSAREKINLIFIDHIIGSVPISDVSAAMAYGGSIKDFAVKETDDGGEGLYHTVLIPTEYLGDGYEK